MDKEQLFQKYSRRRIRFLDGISISDNVVEIKKGDIVVPTFLCCLGDRLSCEFRLDYASHRKMKEYLMSRQDVYPMLLLVTPKKDIVKILSVNQDEAVTIKCDGSITRVLPAISDTLWMVPKWSESNLSCARLVACYSNVTYWLSSIGVMSSSPIKWYVCRVGSEAWSEAINDYCTIVGQEYLDKLWKIFEEYYSDKELMENHNYVVDSWTTAELTSGKLFIDGRYHKVRKLEDYLSKVSEDDLQSIGEMEITHVVTPNFDDEELEGPER